MAIWNKKSVLTEAIEDWQARGLLDATTAAQLDADVQSRAGGTSFRQVLVLLAVICLGFAVMSFVAANWDGMGRLTRVGLIFGAMWAFWGGSLILSLRGYHKTAQTCTLGACAMFGAGIMLISQIYHIQGSPKAATWLWAMGTLLAAALTLSVPALVLSLALLMTWVMVPPNIFSSNPPLHFDFPLYLLAAGALAYAVRSRFAAHLIVFSACIWFMLSALTLVDQGSLVMLNIGLSLAFVMLSTTLWSDRTRRLLRGFERAVILYAIAFLSVTIFAWHVIALHEGALILYGPTSLAYLLPALTSLVICWTVGISAVRAAHPNAYDLIVTPLFATVTFALMLTKPDHALLAQLLMVGGAVWVIRMGWRIEYRQLAMLGFFLFAAALLTTYFETVGTLIGTSVFYLGVGVLLLASVFIIPRLSRKKGDPS
ncbi:DUF2157 domain-containing protein [Neptunicoccus cionae]|uniref:DUF2157 domain-containing protein n=1 Tax=Neptunicoccus cionae TaxID=2035344 RepID=A0A916QZ81_9RHOB|nr:DUF2157 domain-containing protein [Amylibacter cionae]GGA15952.1 hypothetical protein GCM10011498_15420 [Amylibacter cionae]